MQTIWNSQTCCSPGINIQQQQKTVCDIKGGCYKKLRMPKMTWMVCERDISSASPAVLCPFLLPVMSSRLPHCLPSCLTHFCAEEFPSCFRFLNCQTMSVLQFSGLLSSSPRDYYMLTNTCKDFSLHSHRGRGRRISNYWEETNVRENPLLSVNDGTQLSRNKSRLKGYFMGNSKVLSFSNRIVKM